MIVHIEDNFIQYLLELIEGLSDDVNDPYHYPVIRVLVSTLITPIHFPNTLTNPLT